MTSSRLYWLLIFFAVLPLCTSASAGTSEPVRPNIIFFLADDLGWVDISGGDTNLGNGAKYHQTPSIERLVAAGMSFSSAYALQNCAPARAAFLTGQTAIRNGVYDIWGIEGKETKKRKKALLGIKGGQDVRGSAVTIAETLSRAGYVTAHFGKFHVGTSESITSQHGFDFNFGGMRTAMPKAYFAKRDGRGGWSFGRKVEDGLDPYALPYSALYIDKNIRPYSSGLPAARLRALIGTSKHLTDGTTDAAIKFMRQQLSSERPFFINLWHYAPHVPIQSRPDLVAKYDALPRNDSRQGYPGYAGLVEGVDQSLGRVLDFLVDPNGDGKRDDSIENRTLIVFYSDNGSWSARNTPLRGRKGSLFDGGLRVPMIAAQPGMIPAGSTSNTVVSITDFYRTFAELARAKLPTPEQHRLDSFSLVDTLRGDSGNRSRKALYVHLPGYHSNSTVPSSLIIRDAGKSRYKLWYEYQDSNKGGPRFQGGRCQLYDLTQDIGESRDLLAATPIAEEHRAVAGELSRELIGWLKKMDAPYPTIRHPDPNSAMLPRVGPPPPFGG